MSTTHLSQPCACGTYRIPYQNTAVVAADSSLHRLSHCAGHPESAVPARPPAPRLLAFVCEHGESRWATGPDPRALVAELGCCDKAVA